MSFSITMYWSLTYFVSALTAISTAFYVLLRNRKSLLHFLFFIYGVISSSYLFVNFLIRIILNPEIALQLYRFSNSLYFVSIALTLIFIRTLAGKKENWMFIIPPMLVSTVSGFINYELQLTNFGWKFVAIPSIEGACVFLYLISYCALIILHLYNLRKMAEVPWLRKKYDFMLWGGSCISGDWSNSLECSNASLERPYTYWWATLLHLIHVYLVWLPDTAT